MSCACLATFGTHAFQQAHCFACVRLSMNDMSQDMSHMTLVCLTPASCLALLVGNMSLVWKGRFLAHDGWICIIRNRAHSPGSGAICITLTLLLRGRVSKVMSDSPAMVAGVHEGDEVRCQIHPAQSFNSDAILCTQFSPSRRAAIVFPYLLFVPRCRLSRSWVSMPPTWHLLRFVPYLPPSQLPVRFFHYLFRMSG
jgi:hypothetical protein